MKTLAPKLAYLGAGVVGAVSWVYVAQVTGRREAWDSGLYFSIVLPALGLCAGILGFLVPEKPWRWGLVPFGAQAGVAFVRDPTANLLPLGLIFFAILGAVCSVPAYAGAFLRRLATNRGWLGGRGP